MTVAFLFVMFSSHAVVVSPSETDMSFLPCLPKT